MVWSTQPCPICNMQAEGGGSARRMAFDYICRRCGEFVIVGDVGTLSVFKSAQRAQLSGWTRDQFELGERPLLELGTIDKILSLPPKQVAERADRLLRWATRAQGSLDGVFNMGAPELVAITYSQSAREVLQLCSFMEQQGLLRKITQDGQWQVTPTGFIEASKVDTAGGSRVGFIAMWFNPDMAPARQAMEAAIRGAGYESRLVDNVEHTGKIDDEIIAQIRKAKFVVADFTGHRGGVYFEAGFAMGLGLNVFWTCRNDEMRALHFDIRQYNCIDWADTSELTARLTRRIEAVLGRGPL